MRDTNSDVTFHRLVQYSTKFGWFYLEKFGGQAEVIDLLQKLSSSLSTTRKCKDLEIWNIIQKIFTLWMRTYGIFATFYFNCCVYYSLYFLFPWIKDVLTSVSDWEGGSVENRPLFGCSCQYQPLEDLGYWKFGIRPIFDPL